MNDNSNQLPLPTTAKLLDIAHTIRTRLLYWELEEYGPIWTVDFVTAFEAESYRFRRSVTSSPNPPSNYIRLLPFDQGPLVPTDEPYPESWERMKVSDEYEGFDGVVQEVSPSLRDRSATWQWMGVFLWTLEQFPTHPAVDYVRTVFDQILNLPMYLRADLPKALWNAERPYCMAGRPVPGELLDRLVSATEKLHDGVVAGAISLDLPDRISTATQQNSTNSVAKHKLLVDLAALTATVTESGDVHSLKSTQAARWIKVLAENEGKWITSTQLVSHDPELDGVRTDRLLKTLPPKLKRRIETSPHTGSRFISS